jgi:hypothetical protein
MASAAAQKVILLRSGWQTVNIGDIGHTPGAIETINRYCPGQRIILWSSVKGTDRGVAEFLTRSFSNLRIVTGNVKDGKPDTPELADAWKEADFLLHSSGSGFPAKADVDAWRRLTNKPYGVFPVSTDPVSGLGEHQLAEGGTLAELRKASMELPADTLSQQLRDVINQADFMFCRDSISLDYLRRQKVHPPVLEMGPDTQFGMTLKDTKRGDAYMATNHLLRGRFLCVIPRVRYTMYSTDRPDDARRKEINDRHVERDMQVLREVMERYIRSTGDRVLVCPEMTYEVELGKSYLVDRLPESLRQNVVWRDTFWLPDEAAAVYAKSAAVISVECHSPIISLVQGTPAIYLRQPTDTCKGQMYPDLGAGDWLFEIDHVSGADVWQAVDKILKHPAAARKKANDVMAVVHAKQRVMGEALRAALIEAKVRPKPAGDSQ